MVNTFCAHHLHKIFKLSIFADLQILVCTLTKFVIYNQNECPGVDMSPGMHLHRLISANNSISKGKFWIKLIGELVICEIAVPRIYII